MAIEANANAGQRLPCERCAKPLLVAPTRETTARIGTEADGSGVCAECIVTGLIRSVTAAKHWFPNFTPESMRLPHVQEMVRQVVRVSGSRIPVDLIDFDEVIANWALPLPKAAMPKGGLFG